VLPIPEPPVPVYTELDARNAKPPPRFQMKAPSGALNVLIVLIDDIGFGQPSAFGGQIYIPTVEALANDRLRFNEFHTTAARLAGPHPGPRRRRRSTSRPSEPEGLSRAHAPAPASRRHRRRRSRCSPGEAQGRLMPLALPPGWSSFPIGSSIGGKPSA
jgi:hypothetical protein